MSKNIGRYLTVWAVVLLCLAGAALAGKSGAGITFSGGASGVDVVKMGHLSCTFCKMAHPDQNCKAECCAACLKAGDPALLTDAEGNNYVLINLEHRTPLLSKERMKLAGKEITVKGLLVKGKGVQVIYVESMEKMKPHHK